MINVFGRHEKNKEAPLSYRSILVPVDGTEASLRAVEFACNIARRGRAKVHVVHVIEVRRALRLDADLTEEAQHGEEVLTQAELAARRQDYEVDGELLQARDAGHAIVDEAIERNSDVIVMGVPYTRPFGEFELSRVPTQVMKTAPCEVVLLRMPAE